MNCTIILCSYQKQDNDNDQYVTLGNVPFVIARIVYDSRVYDSRVAMNRNILSSLTRSAMSYTDFCGR